jgi:tetratricopeptide (TPR) repeat protein
LRSRYWEPHHTPRAGRKIEEFAPLKEAAEITGGSMELPGIFLNRSANGIFNKVFNDYRHSYILRYTAEGVARDGWHEITVTTPKYPSYELHARKGYLVEPLRPPVDRAKLPAGSLLAMLAAEEANDPAEVDRAIRRNGSNADLLKLLNDFKSGGNAFPSAPRKEFVLALELAESALPTSFPPAKAAAYDLLARYGRLIRQVSGEDTFERDWLWAQIALAEAPVRPAEAQKIIAAALKRFPAEPRFILARAIASEESATAKDSNRVLADYDVAAAEPSTRDEALVRKARLLTRLGSQAEALLTLDKTGPIPNDLTLRFWRELIRAKTLDDLGRLTDATAAYRSALAIAPEAQSARVGLMNVLARTGQGADARVIADAIGTASPDVNDPWWVYWQADYRFFPDLMKRLRGLAQ